MDNRILNEAAGFAAFHLVFAVVAAIATFAAVQEGHYIRTKQGH